MTQPTEALTVELLEIYERSVYSCLQTETRFHKTLTTDLAKILAAARAHLEGGWRPIETAPKDVRVIVWDGKTVHVARWSAKYDCFIPLDSVWNITPTHWQSLPRAPE